MATDTATVSPLMQAAAVLVVTALLVKGVRWLLWYRSYFHFFNSLPGETSFSWIWGNLHMFHGKSPEDRMKYTNGLMQKFPQFFRLWLGPFRAVVSLYHPDSVRDLLKTSEPKPHMYNFALPWLGAGLLLANGDRWARARRLLTPAFHFDILRPYVAISNTAAEQLMNRISDHVKQGRSFEVYGLVSLCTLDVILQCAMSHTDDIQNKGETHPYVHAVNKLSELWFERGRQPLLYNDFIYKLSPSGRQFMKHCHFVHSVSETIIQARREKLDSEGPSTKKYLDFLDILLTAKDNTGQGLTSLEIRNEVDTFLFEGHDTTASAISWTLYSLAQHPQIQAKAQAEVDSILEGRSSHDIEWGDLSRLEYLLRVIKEGMRLHCPVPFIQRQLTKPSTIDGVTLPEGTFCTIHLLNLHHNPTIWKDPWTFDPDRFHPDNMKDKDTYAFVPFSAGPRNCIGQHFAMNEEKVILGRLLHKFNFTLDKDHVVKKKPAAVMRAENGIKLLATPRDHYLLIHATSCYWFVTQYAKNYESAESYCRSSGGHLATVKDNPTQTFLQNSLGYRFRIRGAVWIGLKNSGPGGQFLLPTGVAPDYSNWNTGEPRTDLGAGNGCTVLDMSARGKWSTLACTTPMYFAPVIHPFVCEFFWVKTLSFSASHNASHHHHHHHHHNNDNNTNNNDNYANHDHNYDYYNYANDYYNNANDYYNYANDYYNYANDYYNHTYNDYNYANDHHHGRNRRR
ncbi:hypothetical protein ACOMHN_044777 [Nucella lapillus]